MNTNHARVEKFFFALLIINPFFDLIGGIFIYLCQNADSLSDVGVPWYTPSFIFRMVIFVLFIVYLIVTKDKKSILVIVPIGIAWAFTIAGEFFFAAEFSLFADMQYIAKFIFNICVLLVYWRVFQRSSLSKDELLEKINWILTFTLLWITASIIICSILDIGFATYENRGIPGLMGVKGFFYAGNDLTGIIMLLTPLTIAFYLKTEKGLSVAKKLFWLTTPAMALSALLQIGTKTAFVIVFLILLGFFIYGSIIWLKQKNTFILKRMGMILLAAVIINIIMVVLTKGESIQGIIDSVARIFVLQDLMGTERVVLSGRDEKLGIAFAQLLDGGLYSFLFGIGRGTQETIIEMDIIECFLYYGIVGAVAMLWLYIKLGIDFFRNFFKNADIVGVALFLSIGLCSMYSFLAGHILFSVSSGFYFAFVLLYTVLYYTEEPKNMSLFQFKRERMSKADVAKQ